MEHYLNSIGFLAALISFRMLWIGGLSGKILYFPTSWDINPMLPPYFAVLLLHEQVTPALASPSTTVVIQDQRNDSRPLLCIKEDGTFQVTLQIYLCDAEMSNYFNLLKNQCAVVMCKYLFFSSSTLQSFGYQLRHYLLFYSVYQLSHVKTAAISDIIVMVEENTG